MTTKRLPYSEPPGSPIPLKRVNVRGGLIPPWVVFARSTLLAAVIAIGLAISPCAARAEASRAIAEMPAPRMQHAAVRLPDGRVLLVGGVDGSSVATSAVFFDPKTQAWSDSTELGIAYSGSTATILSDGRVLLVGEAGSQIFDPVTKSLEDVSSLVGNRRLHTAMSLADGRVLVAGGVIGSYNPPPAVFDPDALSWLPVPSDPAISRINGTIVRLASGKVLLLGGEYAEDSPFAFNAAAEVEIFDPATNAWTSVQSMKVARKAPTAVLMRNGRVLVIGGLGVDNKDVNAVEIFDPKTGNWDDAAPISIARENAKTLLLDDGRVVLFGGQDVEGPVRTIEIFQPRLKSWSVVGMLEGDGSALYDDFSTTLLTDGRVLVAGGGDPLAKRPSTHVELFDPRTEPWQLVDANIDARAVHTATRLPNGEVLVAGGVSLSGQGSLKSAEVFEPQTGTFRAVGSMRVGRQAHTAVPLLGGRVLVIGGQEGAKAQASVEIFDIETNSFSDAPPMTQPRTDHTATLLQDGRVLITGGEAEMVSLKSAEVFDSGKNAWLPVPSMKSARKGHSATLLDDGRVFVVGGYQEASAEIFNPRDNTWTSAGTSTIQRYQHIAVKLQDGRVLIVGGWDDASPVLTAEIFDPVAGTWTSVGPMHVGRGAASGGLLLDGRVLVASGGPRDGNGSTTAEIFDPKEGTWTLTSSPQVGRKSATATLLLDGRLLFAGGSYPSNVQPSINEVFGSSVGTACNGRDQCVSGVCVDGVCCDAACDGGGACQSCTIFHGAKVDGVCSEVIVCTPWTCATREKNSSTLQCKDTCETAADCAPDYACNLVGVCEAPRNILVEEGCTAAVDRGEGRGAAFGLLALAGGAWFLRRRVRRSAPLTR